MASQAATAFQKDVVHHLSSFHLLTQTARAGNSSCWSEKSRTSRLWGTVLSNAIMVTSRRKRYSPQSKKKAPGPQRGAAYLQGGVHVISPTFTSLEPLSSLVHLLLRLPVECWWVLGQGHCTCWGIGTQLPAKCQPFFPAAGGNTTGFSFFPPLHRHSEFFYQKKITYCL